MNLTYPIRNIAIWSLLIILSSVLFGCSESERLPVMIPDPNNIRPVPKDKAQDAEWKRVLDKRNNITLVKSVSFQLSAGKDRKLVELDAVPVGKQIRVLAIVELGDDVKSAPQLATISVQKFAANNRGRHETDGYATWIDDPKRSRYLVFEKIINPYDPGKYVLDFTFHSYRHPTVQFNVVEIEKSSASD